MKKIQIGLAELFKIAFILCLSVSLHAQVLQKNIDDRIEPVMPQDYPPGYGIGHLVAGDLWHSFLSQNRSSQLYEATNDTTYGARHLIKPGNFSNWQGATAHYPIAYPWTPWWNNNVCAVVYDSDSTFCPDSVNKKINFAYNSSSRENAAHKHSKYVIPAYGRKLAAANGGSIELITDPSKTPTTRNYVKEAWFVDGKRRQHLVYEAGWPTNVGLDYKIRAHQFAAPNWNNFNDFIIMEISVKNTGEVDINMDGIFEKTNHKIEGYTINHSGTPAISIGTDLLGTRQVNTTATVPQRMGGYISDPDPDGNPWDFNFICAGQTALASPKQDMGFSSYCTRKEYSDLYNGYTFIAAKKGGLPADPAKGTGKLADKNTIWGTDAIGKGKQRGWFHANQNSIGLGSFSSTNSLQMWRQNLAPYFLNGGYDNDGNKVDYRPNPDFFDTTKSSKTFDYLNWVPKSTNPSESQRPSGGKNTYSDRVGDLAFVNFVNETGMSDASTPYANGWGKHTKGYLANFNFNGQIYTSIGPVSIDVGEEVTFVLIYAAGYRLEGIQRAVRAARYTYENDYVVPVTPSLPDIKVTNTVNQTIMLEWDNEADKDANFAGYKIWKSSNFMKYKYLEDGMRLIDKYQEQMTPGIDKKDYRKPINPKFNAFDDVASVSTKGQYAGYTWGTWELMRVIPKAELNNYKTAKTTGYTYAFEDKGVVLGFTYWYYISAYAEGTFKGPGGETTTRIETHSTNRNGASGLWVGTYPFATRNAYWPKADNLQGLKDIGASITVNASLKTTADLNAGVYKVGVRPNPYKRAALHDDYGSIYDHKMLFYNLPPKAKITILDVAGKVIDIINFESSDPTKGSIFWDMFSKDGIEVASGLYVYFVEWEGGKTNGKFAILR